MKIMTLLLVLSTPVFTQTQSSPWKLVASKEDGETLYVHIKPQRSGKIVTTWEKLVLSDGTWSITLQQYNCPARRFRLLVNVFLINGEALPGNLPFLANGMSTSNWGSIPKGSAAAQAFSELCLAH
jgi:hypothetical protein